jgi:hypothetical protein
MLAPQPQRLGMKTKSQFKKLGDESPSFFSLKERRVSGPGGIEVNASTFYKAE